MTRNILVATIFTLGTALLLGVIFLGERPRLEEATGAITAERVERGARDYEQYCASCHGLAGQGGVGPRINNIEVRKQDDGSMDGEYGVTAKYGTLRNYIEAILVSGIRDRPMPAFGAQGILRDDQIENITSYVLSWNSPVTDTEDLYAGLPPGVQARADEEATKNAPTPDPNANPVDGGKLVFQAQCASCHNINDQGKIGPGLGGLFSPEGTVSYGTLLPNNQPVNEENVRAWILGGTAAFPESIPDVTGKDWGVMPPIRLGEEELANVITWLRVHDRAGNETEEANQIREAGNQQGQPGDENNIEGNQNVPTVVPTGQAQPNTAPGTQQQPTSEVNATADAESTDATAEAVETMTATP